MAAIKKKRIEKVNNEWSRKSEAGCEMELGERVGECSLLEDCGLALTSETIQ